MKRKGDDRQQTLFSMMKGKVKKMKTDAIVDDDSSSESDGKKPLTISKSVQGSHVYHAYYIIDDMPYWRTKSSDFMKEMSQDFEYKRNSTHLNERKLVIYI